MRGMLVRRQMMVQSQARQSRRSLCKARSRVHDDGLGTSAGAGATKNRRELLFGLPWVASGKGEGAGG